MMARFSAWRMQAQQRWQTVSARERLLIKLLVVLCAIVLVWRVLVLGPWRVLEQAPETRAKVGQQLTHMLALQKQAQTLQARPKITAEQAMSLVSEISRANGPAIQWPAASPPSSGRVMVQIKDMTPLALAQWLTSLRMRAQTLPAEVHLVHDPAKQTWTGSMVLVLPDGLPQ